jgi:hypothetical protein
MEYQFDVNRVIGIKIYESEKKDYVWLPQKERPSRFFGLIKVPPFKEGFYPEGDYSGYGPRTKEKLEEYKYLINEKKEVWKKCNVTVYLESEYSVSLSFNTDQEGRKWVDNLKYDSGKNFQIVINE